MRLTATLFFAALAGLLAGPAPAEGGASVPSTPVRLDQARKAGGGSAAARSEGKPCRPSELRLRSICKAGAACPSFCVPRPGKQPGGLCPDGLRWEARPCPPKARCLLGGRCAPSLAAKKDPKDGKPAVKAGGKLPSTVPAKVPGAPASLAVKCGVGRVPTKVQCIRTPCPTLCLPARLDPSLKASPAVKPL